MGLTKDGLRQLWANILKQIDEKIVESGNNIAVDDALSDSSINPVQNKVIKEALDNKVDKTYVDNSIANLDVSNEVNNAVSSANNYTDEKIALLMDNSSEAVDSIMELATAMKDNENVVDALEHAIGEKVDKVDGKGLSTNDFTNADKTKLNSSTSIQLISWEDSDF